MLYDLGKLCYFFLDCSCSAKDTKVQRTYGWSFCRTNGERSLLYGHIVEKRQRCTFVTLFVIQIYYKSLSPSFYLFHHFFKTFHALQRTKQITERMRDIFAELMVSLCT